MAQAMHATGEELRGARALDSSIARMPLGGIAPESVAEAPVKVLEREAGVRLARQHQQWIDVLLWAALSAFARLFRYEHDRAHEFVLSLFVRLKWGRKKGAVGITVLVAQAWRWRPDMRGDPLRSYADPVAAEGIAASARKL